MSSKKSRTSSHEHITVETDLKTLKTDTKALSEAHLPSESNSFEKPLLLNNSEDDITESYKPSK